MSAQAWGVLKKLLCRGVLYGLQTLPNSTTTGNSSKEMQNEPGIIQKITCCLPQQGKLTVIITSEQCDCPGQRY